MEEQGKMEELTAEIDATPSILDYCANSNTLGRDKTLPVFIDILREKRPTTPIICLSKVYCYREWLIPPRQSFTAAMMASVS